MNQPATLTWFARHELRLFWRDMLSMLTSGKRGRESVLLVVALVFAFLVHLIASVIILPFSRGLLISLFVSAIEATTLDIGKAKIF